MGKLKSDSFGPSLIWNAPTFWMALVLGVSALLFGAMLLMGPDCDKVEDRRRVNNFCYNNFTHECLTNSNRPPKECEELAIERCLVCRNR